MTIMSGREFEMLKAAITAVCLPYKQISAERINDACKMLASSDASGTCAPISIDPAIPCEDVAKLLGVCKRTVEYHARRGRLRKVCLPGAKRACGYVAADVRKILNGDV